MHVGSVHAVRGRARPRYDDFARARSSAACTSSRATARSSPCAAARPRRRPVWIDDPHFNLALPHPPHRAARAGAATAELQAARRPRLRPARSTAPSRCGRSGSSTGVGDDRFALITKTHHCLVDGVSGVDIATVLFDLEPDPPPQPAPARAVAPAPRAERAPSCWPTRWSERATAPLDAPRAAGDALADPAGTAAPARPARSTASASIAAARASGAAVEPAQRADRPAPALRRGSTPTSRDFKAIKNALGGTVNDVVLTAVTGALRTWLLDHGHDDRRPDAAGDGPDVRPRRRRARRARQPGRRRCTRRCRSASADPRERFAHRARGDGRAQGVRPGGRRGGAHAADGLRAADDPRARPRACRPASGCST